MLDVGDVVRLIERFGCVFDIIREWIFGHAAAHTFAKMSEKLFAGKMRRRFPFSGVCQRIERHLSGKNGRRDHAGEIPIPHDNRIFDVFSLAFVKRL